MSTNNPYLEHAYEYMIRNMMPITSLPCALKTVAASMVKIGSGKTVYTLPFDREEIMNVVGMLIQYGVIEDEDAPIKSMRGNVLVNSTKKHKAPIRDKYFFENHHTSLVEFYDFLKQVDDDFLTFIQLIMSWKDGDYTRLSFRVYLHTIVLMNSDGEMGYYLKKEVIDRWDKMDLEQRYQHRFSSLVDKEINIPIFISIYDYRGH